MSAKLSAGILNVDKPYGMTSMEVVRRTKRASGIKRVGHGGTLDPVATGVLPICIGPATRMMQYLIDGTKEYRSVIELGVTTDTYDSLGEVTETADCTEVSREQIESALKSFHGEIPQVPPMFSALKRDGKRLYDLAREGIEVEREPRKVTVYGIELTEFEPPLATVEVHCGRGFYMRSLAHDLGQILGCGGHMKTLKRLRVGPFLLRDALAVEPLDDIFADGAWTNSVHAPDVVLDAMRAVVAGSDIRKLVLDGRPIPPSIRIPASTPEERCRVYTTDGQFIAIMRFDSEDGQWKPEKVFHPS
ncbi:MAG: tRNA pseudouridine(55) synthase TruB [SAR202 cluster bacterium]|jgi:tRNA pseudouridine55 synthase|nr:tRNA pseudouridine(55) synthase TruB [SAR202 cluster bacterium]MDP6799356.1 tRNA pseudouridine(55) synthase TruB [SAR202 cluster bacterium]|tara:strand:+ start:382 stop:1293 length:912 start_codon:yes stop_codon:yes gene_type:complete